ncbi:hypothetical protein HN903_03320 [archaeon]|nr:hypothetical protein [archaeon]MBT6955681.1 hypothetical protein [archaeon]MBT7128760.1 hypothetical protein [archaeon]
MDEGSRYPGQYHDESADISDLKKANDELRPFKEGLKDIIAYIQTGKYEVRE